MDHNSPIEQVAEPAAQTATYGGGSAAFGAWVFSLGDIAAMGGLLVALVGLCFQIYFGVRRERRQREIHNLQLQALKERKDD